MATGKERAEAVRRAVPVEAMADHLDGYKQEMRRIFELVDEDGSGVVSKAEFVAATKENGGDNGVMELVRKSRLLSGLVASGDFDAAFSRFDTDNGGNISFDEFWAFAKAEAEDSKLRSMFAAIDQDGSRFITKAELVVAFKKNEELLELVKSSKVFGKLVENNDWDRVLAAMDTDKSGAGENQIDYPEFWRWAQKIAAKAHMEALKERARAQAALLAAGKGEVQKQLFQRLCTHTFKLGAAQGGVFSVSIVPDHVNFKCL